MPTDYTPNLNIPLPYDGDPNAVTKIATAITELDEALGVAGLVRPHASVTHTANQSIANNALTALAFDTETFDAFAMHDPSTNNSRLTLLKAGLWEIGGSVTWATNGSGIRAMAVRMNGTTRYAQDGPGGTAAGNVSHAHSVIVRVTGVAEYAELCVYQNSGGALNVEVQSAFSPRFWAVWLAN